MFAFMGTRQTNNLFCRLAKLLGGDLHIVDRVDGVRGVRFRLRLPLRYPPERHRPMELASTMEVERRATAFLLRRNVLVVDDSEQNRRIARRKLELLGCVVFEATDGDEVLRALSDAAAEAVPGPIDIILMDIEMQRMGGVAALQALRSEGWLMAVIAVTGNAGAADAAECACWAAAATSMCGVRWFPDSRARVRVCFSDINRGFKRILPKPFSSAELRDALLAGCQPRVLEVRDLSKSPHSTKS